MKNLPGGWIYILFSSADYTRSKIGKTDGNPLIRFRQLRTGDPQLALHTAYYIPNSLGPTARIESGIHYELKDYRISTHDDGASEWFKLSMNEAENVIDCMLSEWFDQEISGPHNIHLEIPIKMYESDIKNFYEPASSDHGFAEFTIENNL